MKTKILLSLIAACLALGAVAEDKPATATASVKRVSVEEFDQLRAGTNVVVLDVRTIAEFEKGCIPGAKNLDINSPRFGERLAELDRSKTYLVNCAVGMRSARACKRMASLGFTNVFDLADGFDGWSKARKPVER
jgi:rhodanese-related sulfurtransferase